MIGSTPTILIVDDESANRKLLEVLLQPEGYLTRSAASGEDALILIAESAPDLILLDVMMPGMNGYELAKKLKADTDTANIPIIMMSALVDRAARLAGLDAGAEEFLTKPVDRAELWLRVRNLLRLKAFGHFMQNHSAILEKQIQSRTADLQRFRTAMDATADAIMLVNRRSMLFIEVNATACTMFGYTRDELFRLGPIDLLNPEHINNRTGAELERIFDGLIAGDTTLEFTEARLRHKDGTAFQVEIHRHAQRSGEDWLLVGVLRDLTERKDAQNRLHHMAHHDALTGLPNHAQFQDTLKNALIQAAENDWIVAVLSINLDHFKNVNDMLGHALSDELLRQFSHRLVKCVRIRDTAGRLGGDEFGLILLVQDNDRSLTLVTHKIREMLLEPFDLQGRELKMSVSIGIAIYPDDADDAETLLKYANTAMYRAKQAGRDTFRFFTAEMNTAMLARLDLEAALRKAVENDEFVLHYQPKVQLVGGHITGLEALLRWNRPGFGLVSPQTFIPALEEMGLIVRAGNWVIATACRQIGIWLRSGVGPMQISVNVSGSQFVDGDLEGDVLTALADNDIPAQLLELELTESSLMANVERTIVCMENLKRHGVQISIDDFGTGYSSLAYLRRFPIDKLKIDIAFVREITSNPADAAIASAIIGMAHSLKLEVIAEGVETAAQAAYLRNHRCDQMQGYHFSKPLAAAEIEQMLRSDKRLPALDTELRTQLNTLLVVNHDVEELVAIQLLLKNEGYRILCAASAAEGFDLLALHAIKVVLCDQGLPIIGGTEFFDRVKALYPSTQRIILVDALDAAPIMSAFNRGAIVRFCPKPWDDVLLRDTIRDAFELHRGPPDQAVGIPMLRQVGFGAV